MLYMAWSASFFLKLIFKISIKIYRKMSPATSGPCFPTHPSGLNSHGRGPPKTFLLNYIEISPVVSDNIGKISPAHGSHVFR